MSYDTSHDMMSALPARQGHFLLESGYHSDLWLTLDSLFIDQRKIAPLIEALAAKIRAHDVTATCGPLLGGAFLAQSIARNSDLKFFYLEQGPLREGLFRAEYRMAPELSRQVQGERVALIDDVISAGSSVRATHAALEAAGAKTIVVAALMTLGTIGISHFASQDIAVEALTRREFTMWKPADCPLCRDGQPLIDPRV